MLTDRQQLIRDIFLTYVANVDKWDIKSDTTCLQVAEHFADRILNSERKQEEQKTFATPRKTEPIE